MIQHEEIQNIETNKNKIQQKILEILIIQDKKLLIYLMIMLKLDLTLPIKQNRDQNVKY